MSLRVKKELRRIYDGLLSVTVVCACRVKKTGMSMASKGAACAEGAQAMSGALHAVRRAGGNAKNVNAKNINDKSPQSALTIFRRFFGSLPLSSQIAQPVHSLSISSAEFEPCTFHNESILDANSRAGAQMGTSMPFSARRRRLVWLRKTGLDAPCATVNLARDALDESLNLTNAAAV
ncbi:MAG: hypothetical protein HZB82_07065 [Deltaproteobacteria bacterium]|nr:hypothetical protein [Deltaproteobacteria bacterium]